MTTAVSSNVLVNDNRRYVVNLTGTQSDTTGETDVVKVDISALTMAAGSAGASDIVPTSLVVERIDWNVRGFDEVILEWDADVDNVIAVLPPGDGYRDWRREGGLIDPKTSGATGDITLTSTGAAATGAYDITLYLRKKE